MKRLNVKLTLQLVGIMLFSVVGVYFLHDYQLGRNADFLRVQAESAREAGDAREAIKQYNQYLKHRDDSQGYSALAELVVEIAKDPDATNQDRYRAYNILEEAIRRHPDLDDVRRRLIDYTMLMRRWPETLEHIQYLLLDGIKDADLDLKIAVCNYALGEEEKSLRKLYELLGFDEQTEQFAAEPPAGANQTAAFELLAKILRAKTDGAKRADAVMTQLVNWNPDSAKAHLARANYLINSAGFDVKSPEFTAIKPELDRAFELAPDDVEVVLAVAVYAIAERDFVKAEELLGGALKEHPKSQEVYLRLSQLATAQGDTQKAAGQLELGLKQATNVQIILERLIDLQFQLNDLNAARVSCQQMRERGTFAPELIRYYEARLKFADGDFLEASRDFANVRPALTRYGNPIYLQQLDLLLGRCYERLSQPDRQLEVYRRVLQTYPDQLGARVGEATALQILGRFDQAETSVSVLAANAQRFPYIQTTVLQMLINAEMRKPEADRDWTGIEKIAGMIYEDKSRSELNNLLLKGDLLIMQDRLAEAREVLNVARKQAPKEVAVWMSLAKLLVRDERTRDKLPQLLDLAEKELGDVLPLRIERIRAVARNGGEQAAGELKKLEQGLDQFSEPQRISLMTQLGYAYLQVGDYAEVKRCWQNVLEKDPKNAQLRQLFFELALDHKDEAVVNERLKEIRDSRHFGPQSPLYKYCAASEILSRLNNRGQRPAGELLPADRKDLADARKLVDEGIAIRAEWSVLWRLRAGIDQIEGNVDSAIASYQRSLDYNRVDQSIAGRHLVQLLYATKRYTEANEALKYLGSEQTSDIWRRTIADIKFKSGGVDKALEMAEKDAQEHPEKIVNHLWYGQLLNKAGRTDEAEQAFRKATEVGPEAPETWELLVRQLINSKKKNEAMEAIREATKTESENPVAMARLYAVVGDNAQAEHFYKAALEEHPDDLIHLHRLADFYFSSMQAEKATPYLDQIIDKAPKSPDPLAQEHLAWARRYKAEGLSAARSYEQTLEATELIGQNAKDGKLRPDDTMAMVRMLAGRPDPISRKKAAELLEKLQETRKLNAGEQALLAQLYDSAGNWTKAQEQFLAAITQRGDDPNILLAFSKSLIVHEDFESAARWVKKLDELVAKSPASISESSKQLARELKARLLIKDGETEQAAQLLDDLLSRPLPQNKLFRLEEIARIMETLQLYDAAEKLLDEYMSQEPRGTIAMAAFLGRRGKVDRAFALLDESRKNQPMVEILPCGLEALRLFPEQATKERFALLESWGRSGLEAEANSQQIKLLLAELYDLQGRYDEVIKIYRELLDVEESSNVQKAVVKNNLAFVLAITKPKPDSAQEALKLTEEAIRILGPTSDLLDTRALAYLALGKAAQAVADLRVASQDAPTFSKFFHLAQVEKQANNLEGARIAMAKAEELGLDVNRLTPQEKKSYLLLKEALK